MSPLAKTARWRAARSLDCTPYANRISYSCRHPCYNRSMAKARPIGSLRINHAGYVQIKTALGQRRWPFEHRVIWEAAHGPIPHGHYIHHINSVRTDNRLENLALCTSNSEHFRKYHHALSVEHGKHIGRSGKSKPKSPEHRANIALALRGKPKSDEHRQRTRDSWERRRAKFGPSGSNRVG
jgi:hypothetical protein